MKIPGLRGMSPIALGKAVFQTLLRDDVVDLAAQLAFYVVLALFPFAIFLVTVLGFLPIHGLEDQIFSLLRGLMPGSAAELFESTVRGVTTQKRSGLLIVSLAGAVWTASGGLSALVTTLDRAYEVKETRSWMRVRLLSIGLTLLSAVAVIVGTAGLVLGPNFGHHVSAWFGLGTVFDTAWRYARWPTVLVSLSAMLAALYYACPNVRQKFTYLTPGSVTAMLLLAAASAAFNFYAAKLGNYNATYGALGGAIVLITWIWISAIIVLVGGVINAVIWRASEEADKGEKLGRTMKHEPVRGSGRVDLPPADDEAQAGQQQDDDERDVPSTWLPRPPQIH